MRALPRARCRDGSKVVWQYHENRNFVCRLDIYEIKELLMIFGNAVMSYEGRFIAKGNIQAVFH